MLITVDKRGSINLPKTLRKDGCHREQRGKRVDRRLGEAVRQGL